MASPNRPAPNHLAALAEELADAPDGRGFFALLRRVEAATSHQPRLGDASGPRQNGARLAHNTQMAFPSSTLGKTRTTGRGDLELAWNFLGLTGPMGPMPDFMTEYLYFEGRYASEQPFTQFLDLFNERALQLFYRAWANGSPGASRDRPEADRFRTYVGALGGVASDRGGALAAGMAGGLAQRASPSLLGSMLTHAAGVAVRVREFTGGWRPVSREDWSRIGKTGANASLGVDAVAGTRVFLPEGAFTLEARAETQDELVDCLPGGPRANRIAEIASRAVTPDLDWTVELSAPEPALSGARLDGTARMGWNAWLAPPGRAGRRATVRLSKARLTAAARHTQTRASRDGTQNDGPGRPHTPERRQTHGGR